jgi:integrase
MRFTDRSIDALKPKAERYEVWEDGRTGLGLRVTPRGVKTFVFMFRFLGKATRMTLGPYSKTPATGISLATARRMWGEAKEVLDAGINPGARVVEERQAAIAAETVAELVELYLEKWARPRKRSANEDERMLNKEVVPIWGHRKAGDIRKRDVVALLDDVVNRGAPIQANRTLAGIRKLFNFGLSREISGLTNNPCTGVGMPSPENERRRRLSDVEIITFWNGLNNETVGMSGMICLALRLQLATAVRRGEVAGAAWAEFDLDEARWTIPAERAKNSVEQLVPLNSLALSILADLKKLHDDEVEEDGEKKPASKWLFPSPRGGRPIIPSSISHALRRNLPHIGLENLTPHDLRRTAASLMGRLKVSRFIISRCLNHVDRTVTGRYDVHEYQPEKKDALDRLGTHLESLLAAGSADNVTVLDSGNEARTSG